MPGEETHITHLVSINKTLPSGWEAGIHREEGRIYYLDHVRSEVHLLPPPAAWKEEAITLPYGWEEAKDEAGGLYYLNHVNFSTTRDNPQDSDESPPAEREVTLMRDSAHGFGFIAGSEKPVVVRSVTEGGPSEGKLLPGDEIQKIDGEDVRFSSRQYIIEKVLSASEAVQLTVKQPSFDKTGLKSSFLSYNKKQRLKTKPVRVRFADDVKMFPVHTPKFPSSMVYLPNVLKVYLENGQTKSFKYDGRTLVREVLDNLVDKLGIKTLEHFSLVTEDVSLGPSQRFGILDEASTLRDISSSPESFSWRCILRILYIPKDAYDLLTKDETAFEYFYLQCRNDVVGERFSSELSFDTAVRLAALQIQQHILSIHKKITKVNIKSLLKEEELGRFLPQTIINHYKSKDLKKHINLQIKQSQELCTPGQKNLTEVQAKLHYVKILSESKLFGGRTYGATMVMSDSSTRKTEATILVGPKEGLSQLINQRQGITIPITSFDDVVKMVVTKETPPDETRSKVEVHCSNRAPLTLTLDSVDAKDMVHFINGYHRLFVGDLKHLIFNGVNPDCTTKDPPPYYNKHRVLGSGWNYPYENFQLSEISKGEVYHDLDLSDRLAGYDIMAKQLKRAKATDIERSATNHIEDGLMFGIHDAQASGEITTEGVVMRKRENAQDGNDKDRSSVVSLTEMDFDIREDPTLTHPPNASSESDGIINLLSVMKRDENGNEAKREINLDTIDGVGHARARDSVLVSHARLADKREKHGQARESDADSTCSSLNVSESENSVIDLTVQSQEEIDSILQEIYEEESDGGTSGTSRSHSLNIEPDTFLEDVNSGRLVTNRSSVNDSEELPVSFIDLPSPDSEAPLSPLSDKFDETFEENEADNVLDLIVEVGPTKPLTRRRFFSDKEDVCTIPGSIFSGRKVSSSDESAKMNFAGSTEYEDIPLSPSGTDEVETLSEQNKDARSPSYEDMQVDPDLNDEERHAIQSSSPDLIPYKEVELLPGKDQDRTSSKHTLSVYEDIELDLNLHDGSESKIGESVGPVNIRSKEQEPNQPEQTDGDYVDVALGAYIKPPVVSNEQDSQGAEAQTARIESQERPLSSTASSDEAHGFQLAALLALDVSHISNEEPKEDEPNFMEREESASDSGNETIASESVDVAGVDPTEFSPSSSQHLTSPRNRRREGLRGLNNSSRAIANDYEDVSLLSSETETSTQIGDSEKLSKDDIYTDVVIPSGMRGDLETCTKPEESIEGAHCIPGGGNYCAPERDNHWTSEEKDISLSESDCNEVYTDVVIQNNSDIAESLQILTDGESAKDLDTGYPEPVATSQRYIYTDVELASPFKSDKENNSYNSSSSKQPRNESLKTPHVTQGDIYTDVEIPQEVHSESKMVSPLPKELGSLAARGGPPRVKASPRKGPRPSVKPTLPNSSCSSPNSRLVPGHGIDQSSSALNLTPPVILSEISTPQENIIQSVVTSLSPEDASLRSPISGSRFSVVQSSAFGNMYGSPDSDRTSSIDSRNASRMSQNSSYSNMEISNGGNISWSAGADDDSCNVAMSPSVSKIILTDVTEGDTQSESPPDILPRERRIGSDEDPSVVSPRGYERFIWKEVNSGGGISPVVSGSTMQSIDNRQKVPLADTTVAEVEMLSRCSDVVVVHRNPPLEMLHQLDQSVLEGDWRLGMDHADQLQADVSFSPSSEMNDSLKSMQDTQRPDLHTTVPDICAPTPDICPFGDVDIPSPGDTPEPSHGYAFDFRDPAPTPDIYPFADVVIPSSPDTTLSLCSDSHPLSPAEIGSPLPHHTPLLKKFSPSQDSRSKSPGNFYNNVSVIQDQKGDEVELKPSVVGSYLEDPSAIKNGEVNDVNALIAALMVQPPPEAVTPSDEVFLDVIIPPPPMEYCGDSSVSDAAVSEDQYNSSSLTKDMKPLLLQQGSNEFQSDSKNKVGIVERLLTDTDFDNQREAVTESEFESLRHTSKAHVEFTSLEVVGVKKSVQMEKSDQKSKSEECQVELARCSNRFEPKPLEPHDQVPQPQMSSSSEKKMQTDNHTVIHSSGSTKKCKPIVPQKPQRPSSMTMPDSDKPALPVIGSPKKEIPSQKNQHWTSGDSAPASPKVPAVPKPPPRKKHSKLIERFNSLQGSEGVSSALQPKPFSPSSEPLESSDQRRGQELPKTDYYNMKRNAKVDVIRSLTFTPGDQQQEPLSPRRKAPPPPLPRPSSFGVQQSSVEPFSSVHSPSTLPLQSKKSLSGSLSKIFSPTKSWESLKGSVSSKNSRSKSRMPLKSLWPSLPPSPSHLPTHPKESLSKSVEDICARTSLFDDEEDNLKLSKMSSGNVEPLHSSGVKRSNSCYINQKSDTVKLQTEFWRRALDDNIHPKVPPPPRPTHPPVSRSSSSDSQGSYTNVLPEDILPSNPSTPDESMDSDSCSTPPPLPTSSPPLMLRQLSQEIQSNHSASTPPPDPSAIPDDLMTQMETKEYTSAMSITDAYIDIQMLCHALEASAKEEPKVTSPRQLDMTKDQLIIEVRELTSNTKMLVTSVNQSSNLLLSCLNCSMHTLARIFSLSLQLTDCLQSKLQADSLRHKVCDIAEHFSTTLQMAVEAQGQRGYNPKTQDLLRQAQSMAVRLSALMRSIRMLQC